MAAIDHGKSQQLSYKLTHRASFAGDLGPGDFADSPGKRQDTRNEATGDPDPDPAGGFRASTRIVETTLLIDSRRVE